MNYSETLKKFGALYKQGGLGVLTKALNFTDEPRFFQFCCTSPEKGIDEPHSAAISTNEQSAKVRAMGESIERICLDNPPSEFEVSTYEDISERAIDPALFLNFRNEDMDSRRDEYEKSLRKTSLAWAQGTDLTSNEPVLVPAQLVYVDYPFDEPMIRPRISTGAAAHETINEAMLAGIMEVVERDAFLLRYYCKTRIPRIRFPKDHELAAVERYFARYLLEVNVFETTTDLEIPSFACILIDKTGVGPAISIGLKSGLNPSEVILAAILEAQQVRQWIRYSYVEDGRPVINEPNHIDTPKSRGYFWYGLKRIKDLAFLLDSPDDKQIMDISVPELAECELASYFSSKRIQIICVEMTSREIKQAGFHVVKMILPQLHPLHLDERFPCLYSERLSKYLEDKPLNRLPQPFI